MRLSEEFERVALGVWATGDTKIHGSGDPVSFYSAGCWGSYPDGGSQLGFMTCGEFDGGE